MAYGIASDISTYLPTTEATGGLTVSWTRSREKFPINRWAEIRPVTRKKGFYARFSPDFATRSLGPAGSAYRWKDGADRPNGANNQPSFEFEPYRCVRYDYPCTIGQQALQQAELMIDAVVNEGLIQQAMTERTRIALGVLAGATWGSNTAAVNGGILPGGQNMINGTTLVPNLRTALLYGLSKVALATGGAVTAPEDLVLLISPDLARQLAVSQEVNQIFIQSQFALDYATGKKNVNFKWGLPEYYAGFRIVVEDTVYNSAPMGANSPTMNFAMGSSTAYMLARPGLDPVNPSALDKDGNALDEEEAPPIRSTVVGLFMEENTVEIFDEPKHRRVETHVASDYDYRLTSPLGGFLYTATNT